MENQQVGKRIFLVVDVGTMPVSEALSAIQDSVPLCDVKEIGRASCRERVFVGV